MFRIETTKSIFNHKILYITYMFRCLPNFRLIQLTNYKIIIFKIEKQAFLALPKVECFGFLDFQKIYLNLIDNRSSFYGKKLS